MILLHAARISSGLGRAGERPGSCLQWRATTVLVLRLPTTPLVEALLAIIDAARAYLPPDGIGKDAFIARVLEATDNPRIIAALAAHGHPVAG
jgi:hypothetical protein